MRLATRGGVTPLFQLLHKLHQIISCPSYYTKKVCVLFWEQQLLYWHNQKFVNLSMYVIYYTKHHIFCGRVPSEFVFKLFLDETAERFADIPSKVLNEYKIKLLKSNLNIFYHLNEIESIWTYMYIHFKKTDHLRRKHCLYFY